MAGAAVEWLGSLGAGAAIGEGGADIAAGALASDIGGGSILAGEGGLTAAGLEGGAAVGLGGAGGAFGSSYGGVEGGSALAESGGGGVFGSGISPTGEFLGASGGAGASVLSDYGSTTGPGSPGTSFQTTPGGATTSGATPASAGGGLFGSGASSIGDFVSSLFGKGGAGLGGIQALSGVYGLLQSEKLRKLATQPNVMGEKAVQRSMAAQGYQGSGNMMAALSQYGINGSQAAAQAGMGPLVGDLSSLGLITSALPKIFGTGG